MLKMTDSDIHIQDLQVAVDERNFDLADSVVHGVIRDILDSMELALGEHLTNDLINQVFTEVRDYVDNHYDFTAKVEYE